MLLRIALALALGGSLMVSGCSSDKELTAYDTKKPLDQMSNEEWCAYYGHFLSNPQLTPKAREIDIQRMRSRGCTIPS